MRRYQRIALFIVFNLVLLCAVDAIYSISYGISSYNWDSTTGVVTTSHLINNSNSNPGLSFYYTYTVNSKNYTSGNFIPEGPFYVSSFFEFIFLKPNSIVVQHPVGSKIKVYYNPTNPGVSALTPGLSPAHYIDMAFLLLIIGSFILAVLLYNSATLISDQISTPEKIIGLFVYNFIVFGILVSIIAGIGFIYVWTLALAQEIVFVVLILLAILIKTLMTTFILQKDAYVFTLAGLLLGSLIFFVQVLFKGIYSLNFKKIRSREYVTENKWVSRDPNTGKYLLKVTGKYKEGKNYREFTHIVNKSFKNEDSAYKFYVKKINQTFYPSEQFTFNQRTGREVRSVRSLFGKKVYFKTSQNEQGEKQMTMSYDVYSSLFLFIIPGLFFLYDYSFSRLYAFKDYSLNDLGQNILNRSYFVNVHLSPSNVAFSVIFLLLVAIELLYCGYFIVVLIKLFVQKSYLRLLHAKWKKVIKRPNRRKSEFDRLLIKH